MREQDPLFVRRGEWVDCGATEDDPGCIAYQWDNAYAATAWHRWIPGDYHLQPGSPAIDAGTTEDTPTTDIEGNGRPCGAGVDIGAYEFGDCWPSTGFLRGDSNADGAFDTSDAAATLSYLFLGLFAPPCLDAADADDSGNLEITDAIYSLTYLFLGGPLPLSPFPQCGIDERIDRLDCRAYAGCP